MCFTETIVYYATGDVVADPLSKYTYVKNVWWGSAELRPSTKSLHRVDLRNLSD